jgi:hypothetical protein
MWPFFEPRDESAGPSQCQVEIIDPKEQEETVARCRATRTLQGGVLGGSPLVQAEQDCVRRDRTSFTPMIVQVRFTIPLRQPGAYYSSRPAELLCILLAADSDHEVDANPM